MKTALFDYALPEALIARHPPAERDAGRLLVLDGTEIAHRTIRDLPELVPPGALVVVNDTRVLRARLVGRRASGGKVELLLTHRLGEPGERERWRAFGKPAKKMPSGTRWSAGEIEVSVLEHVGDGELEVELTARGGVAAALERSGHVPIPPYLRREDEPEDAERYQTVFAEKPGSVAAPTAGLHLTESLFTRMQSRGIELGRVTLHVGPGTFKPVVTDDLDQHAMHAEIIQVSAELVQRVARARARKAPVVAIGTTVVRALESAKHPENPGQIRAFEGETDILIQPGHRFEIVDALLTNFHLPKSTLLALVAAFAGLEPVLAAYSAAIAEGYRFLSYGDAMWIARRKEP